MTLTEFKKKLSDGHYAKALHAKRAFRGLYPKDRKRATVMVEHHFGTGRKALARKR